MSCPNWSTLVARRDRDPRDGERRDGEQESWERALLHYDTCDRCRDDALNAEPTLLFRRMPAPELGREDLAVIKQAVATMRRALPFGRASRSLAEAAEHSAPFPQRIGLRSLAVLRSPRVWLQAAALGVVALGAVLLGTALFEAAIGKDESVMDLASSSTPASQVTEFTLPAGADGDPAEILPKHTPGLEEPPLVEDADLSYGSIVEVVGQDISFVLVVPSLDV